MRFEIQQSCEKGLYTLFVNEEKIGNFYKEELLDKIEDFLEARFEESKNVNETRKKTV